MIQRVTVDGREGSACFLSDKFVPVEEAKASFLKIVFDDGGQLILGARPAPKAKAWDESQHPRDPAGSPTGGQFTGSGGDKPSSGKKGKAEKVSDFAKDGIILDQATRVDSEQGKKFLDLWNEHVDEAPAEFKKNFVGGLPGTMSVTFREATNVITVSGGLYDKEGPEATKIGEYTRDIDLDDHNATSSFFRLYHGKTGKDVGKKMLKANVEMYQKMGVTKVKLHANIDVGGYAWAKYGYVPDRTQWNALSGEIDDKIRSMSSGGDGTGPASSWEDLTPSQRQVIEIKWYREAHEQFLSYEVDNWRDNGGALDEAKVELADGFGVGSAWAIDAIDAVKEERDIPFTTTQLISAIDVKYGSDGEGGGDLKIEFNDAALTEPQGAPDPNQQNLPGIEPAKPHERLTKLMRDQIGRALEKSFDNEASERSTDIDPPDWINDSVRETMNQEWDAMDDDEKFAWAERYAPEQVKGTEPDKGTGEISDEEANVLHRLTASDDPKAIWAIADSQWGKELLLGTDWYGSLNLTDRESMDRFNAYVSKAPKAA
jgi:hypothetical protein